MWPIEGEDGEQILQNFQQFLREGLLLREWEIGDLNIEAVEQVSSAKNGPAYDKFAVLFRSSKGRDDLNANARRLAPFRTPEDKPTAGFLMQIPQYLKSSFKNLKEIGFRL